MRKIILFLAVILAVAAVAGCTGKDSVQQGVDENALVIFFYGQECPHCKIVEKYFSDNKIEEKIKFEKGEVYHNKTNAEIMARKAAECKIDAKELGVPMLFADGQCYFGDKDVIQYFEQKIGGSEQRTVNSEQ